MFRSFRDKLLDRLKIGKILDKLKLNEKFMIMYILCVILPLVITDAILFRSVYRNELENQSHYRDAAIEAYSNYLSNLLSYDADLSSAMDINKNLNSFINKWYSLP